MVDYFNALLYSLSIGGFMQQQNLEVVQVSYAAIQTIIWDNKNNYMIVKFKDSPLYVYPTVPKSLFDAFVKAPSKGNFFRTQIKSQHPDFNRLDN